MHPLIMKAKAAAEAAFIRAVILGKLSPDEAVRVLNEILDRQMRKEKA